MDKQKSALELLMRALSRRSREPEKTLSSQPLPSFLAKARLDRADAMHEALSQHETVTRAP